ncbi:MAG: universal stress protein [Halorientalis sp.]
MGELFDRVLLPVASRDDARTSARALRPYVSERVVAVHVVEKAGGAVDKASVEQREDEAARMFEIVHDELDDVADVQTRIGYGTDVAETLFATAADVDATAIVFTPRGGSRWIRLLTGDVALDLVTETDRPVIVLPDSDGSER